jgi:serine protease DegS
MKIHSRLVSILIMVMTVTGGITGFPLWICGQSADAADPAARIIDTYSSRIFTVHADASREDSKNGGYRLCRNVGSAFLFGSGNYLITMNCIVKDADRITVVSDKGIEYTAVLVGTFSSPKITVLEIDASGGRALPSPASTGRPEPGSDAYLVLRKGMDFTVGSAEISETRPPDGTFVINAIPDMITSGTPVFDRGARLLGLLAAQIDEGESKSDKPLAGKNTSGPVPHSFVVIPADYVWMIAQSIVNSHEGSCGWLGVSSDFANGSPSGGVIVRNVVSGSPAAKAGLRLDDRLTRFNGKAIDSYRHLIEHLSETSPGDTVDLTVVRSGKQLTFEITLAEYPSKNR